MTSRRQLSRMHAANSLQSSSITTRQRISTKERFHCTRIFLNSILIAQ